MKLSTRIGLGALGVTGVIALSAVPAGATSYAAQRACDGSVSLTTSGVGADTHGVFSAGGQSWELGPGGSTTVTFPSIDGTSVLVSVQFTMADGTTWPEERVVDIVDAECTSPTTAPPSPETVAPPVTTSPPNETPPNDPPTSDGPSPTLPSTGSGSVALASAGVALMGAGGAVTLLARRRSARTA
jgi:LPXTG-motif cell wall-anchored protein